MFGILPLRHLLIPRFPFNVESGSWDTQGLGRPKQKARFSPAFTSEIYVTARASANRRVLGQCTEIGARGGFWMSQRFAEALNCAYPRAAVQRVSYGSL